MKGLTLVNREKPINRNTLNFLKDILHCDAGVE